MIGKNVVYTHDEVVEMTLGAKGTPERDQYEAEIQTFLVGEAIKAARLSQKLTQEELAERMGVKRAQVSRLESGRNLTFSTISRAMRALGLNASFEISGVGSFALC